ncbi:hypothetical protein TVAG_168120 [Trichomonas vaginalis G3]|uniref:Uncharacterized protein n=1 Tax=Trichomonas vaginalis (strain ATCC PRA-98 / G3) TaxID=412133 RepID=A2FBI0_TRIV3|nr:proteasome regulatory particle assembly [Trichomonas vaginalis G3]EAX97715.1 hypothetical protein TVAG_168120 [Trichomonas vaginalis G3]KAI5546008.1 proteasome regulatory particle assembly [Trichomonas vaginalis G3]|eukprot:XP_001310645.1 hypothetical protein [Trichomonas vaginalis G3]
MEKDFNVLDGICQLEDKVFGINETNECETIKFIQEMDNDLINCYLENLIVYASYRRRLHWTSLAHLWKEILGDQVKSFHKAENFVKEKEKILSNEYRPSLQPQYYAIIRDDVESMKFLSTSLVFALQVIKINDTEITQFDFSALCGSPKIFKFFVMNGAIITSDTIENAVRGGNVQVLEILRQKNCDFSQHLEGALKYHNNEIAEWILDLYGKKCQSILPSFCILHYNTSFFKHIVKDNIDLIHQKMNDDKKYTCFTAAAGSGNISVVKFLVEIGEDLNERSRKGKAPLHYAASNKNIEIIKFLASKGCNINIKDDSGETALFYAVNNNDLEVVKVLIELGCDVNVKNNNNISAYDKAFRSQCSEITEFLSKYIDYSEYEEEEE